MKWIHPMVWRGLVLTGLFVLGAIFLFSYNQVQKPVLAGTEGRTFERAVVVDILQDNVQENGSRIGDQTVSLQLMEGSRTGEIVEANCPNGMLFGTVCRKGMEVVVLSSRVGQAELHTVYSPDRSDAIYVFIGAFLILLAVIGGKKGIQSGAALVFTFVCFVFLFFPMILRGLSPVVAAIITSALVLMATIYLINGWTVKSLAAMLAALGGILSAGMAALLFGYITSLSGYNVSYIEALMFVGQNTPIDVGQLLFAGILFASLGAVMDIAMDVASASSELLRQNPSITEKELFQGGMNVGRDVMGTMATTLILAFFGGSLGLWVLDYAYDLPYLQLINSNSIGIEIMQGLSGSFGVLLTVPLAARLSARLPYCIAGRKQQSHDAMNSTVHEKSL